MKNSKYIMLLTFVSSLLFSNTLSAESVTYKCHVVLLGGGETIYSVFFSDPTIKLSEAKSSILNDKIYFKTTKKVPIYDIKECVKGNKKFKSKKAKMLLEHSDINLD